MKPYQDLTCQGRLRRRRQLAGAALSTICKETAFGAYRDALREGYEQVRAIPPAQ